MYRGINIKTAAKYNTTIEGIEVNSSILSAAAEMNIANIVKGIGNSLDCLLLILL
jgi:hypothetical protein